MLALLLKSEILAWYSTIGPVMIAAFCFHFTLMLFYGIIAEICGFPMPLDDRYLLGKINMVILYVLTVGGLILFII